MAAKHTLLGQWLVKTFGVKLNDGRYYWNGDIFDPEFGALDDFNNGVQNLFNKQTGNGLTTAETEQMQFNADEAQKAYERQRLMRQTAFQDTVADASAAGINPYFAISGGATGVSSSSQASAPSMSGSPAGLDSLLNLLFAKQRFDYNKAQIGVAKAQKDNIESSTDKNNAETKNIEEGTTGQQLDNEWKRRTLDARAESENLRNSLTREQIRQTRKAIDVADEQISLMIKQEDSEVKKQQLAEAQALLARANAHQVFALTPFMQLELEARGEAERASAQLSAVSAAYQQGLIDTGMIEAVVRQTNADADVKQVEHDLKQYQDDVNHGNISRVAGASDTVIGGLFATMKIALDQIKPGM